MDAPVWDVTVFTKNRDRLPPMPFAGWPATARMARRRVVCWLWQ